MVFRQLLEDHLLPVQMFFNVIPESRFFEIMTGLSRRQSYGFNVCGVEYLEKLEKGDKPFTGIKFYLPTEEVVISNTDFIRHAEMTCQAFLRNNPDKEEQIAEIIDRIRQNFPS